MRLIRWAAVLIGGMLVALLVLPVANVALVAAAEMWRLTGPRGNAYSNRMRNYAISALLVDADEARTPPEGPTLYSYSPTKVDCDIDVEALPQWLRGEPRLWAEWGPDRALLLAQISTDEIIDRRNGTRALRIRYLDDHVGEWERRFLLGCLTGTLAAPVCAWRVNALIAAADAAPVPPDVRQRIADQHRWQQKTLCALAHGLAEMKEPTERR